MVNRIWKYLAGASSGLRNLLLTILLTAAVAGCTAMDGVNVGANIPIGGVNVGANKTIRESPASPPRGEQPPEERDESGAGEDDESSSGT